MRKKICKDIQEESKEDFYTIDCLEESVEDDEITISEEAFMMGYLS